MNQVMKYLHGVDLNINLYAQFGIATKLDFFCEGLPQSVGHEHNVLLSKWCIWNT